MTSDKMIEIMKHHALITIERNDYMELLSDGYVKTRPYGYWSADIVYLHPPRSRAQKVESHFVDPTFSGIVEQMWDEYGRLFPALEVVE